MPINTGEKEDNMDTIKAAQEALDDLLESMIAESNPNPVIAFQAGRAYGILETLGGEQDD